MKLVYIFSVKYFYLSELWTVSTHLFPGFSRHFPCFSPTPLALRFSQLAKSIGNAACGSALRSVQFISV